MGVKWTDEQIRAIETADRGVVVPAAAGSGKTAVLIERTVRLLADEKSDCPAERLLAVTFTKDAANQMKNKLRAALASKIVGETDPERRRWLERQQEMLPLAKISTINSFCLELVKDNLNEFDYRAGIKVADENQAAVILDASIAQALEEMRAETPEQAELLVDALTNNSDSELANHIREFYRFLRSLAFPKEWAEQVLQRFDDPDYIARLFETLTEEYSVKLDRAFKLNEQAAFVAAKLKNGDKILSITGDDLEIAETLKAALNSKSYKQLYKAAELPKFTTLRKPSEKGLTQEEIIDNELAYEQFKQLRESFKATIKSITDDLHMLGSDIEEPMKNAGFIFSALLNAADKLDRIMGERKTELGVAEFNDIERMAMDLLVKKENGVLVRTALAENIVNRRDYRVLLIDEYQDVNNLQEMIFRALSDTDRLDLLGKNVFVVGDVKQSIYRFRLSNPQLFLNASENARDENIEQLCEIRLTKNFRSRQNIIDFVNRVFVTIMSRELGELEYTDAEQLKCGASYGGEDGAVEYMLINDDNDSPDDGLKYEIFGVEQLCIARRIKSLIESGEPVFEGNVSRRAKPSDFCVLSRNKDGCRKIAAALEYVGLKAQSEQTDGYMGSREIMTMVNLLKVIDNPMKDLPMAAVMMSPIMSFTADETARLRMLCRVKDDKPKKLYQIIIAAAQQENADEKEAEKIELHDSVLEEKCRAAVKLITRLRFYSVELTLEELISKIYDETGFFAVASAFENSKQKRANLRLLTQRAAEYEKNSVGSVAGFLRFLESVSASGGDFSQAVTVSGGSDCVDVKTFHSSKGLEYPFVFLTSINKSFNLSDVSAKVLLNENMGVGINYMRHDKLMKVKTISHRIMETVTISEMLSEELRLLYVALTRAKERLFIPFYIQCGGKTDMKKIFSALAAELVQSGGATAGVLKECRSNAQWLAAAVMLSCDGEPLLEAAGRQELADDFVRLSEKINANKPKTEWRFYPEIAQTEQKKRMVTRPAANAENVRRLKENYDYSYPYIGECAASKRSVTEIVSEIKRKTEGDTDPMFYPQLGSLNAEAARLSAAQRGTYTHLFMEYADYTSAESDINLELERLCKRGVMSEREAKGVYINALEKFFGGEFYKRMKSSPEIRREMKFMVRADDAGIGEEFAEYISESGMLQGICDCIFLEKGGYVLVDYKTDGFTDISQLDRYGVQLKLYKAALDIILPAPIKACYIYSFKLADGKEIVM